MKLEYKVYAIHLLRELAVSDDALHITEASYIQQAMQKLDIDEGDLKEGLTKYGMPKKNIPDLEQERMTILYYLLFLAASDGTIVENEKQTLRRLSFELGFRDDQALAMIEVVENNKGHLLEPDKLLGVIRTALN